MGTNQARNSLRGIRVQLATPILSALPVRLYERPERFRVLPHGSTCRAL